MCDARIELLSLFGCNGSLWLLNSTSGLPLRGPRTLDSPVGGRLNAQLWYLVRAVLVLLDNSGFWSTISVSTTLSNGLLHDLLILLGNYLPPY